MHDRPLLPGDAVMLKTGVFAGFRGTVASIDRMNGLASVKITLLGRNVVVDEPPERLERTDNE